jgi:AcrR family transcriptional regulator
MNSVNHKYHHGNLRDEILKAAYNFVLKNGYIAMSLRGIADECNVSATAIYRHYKTKEHLLADVVAKGFIEFNTFVEGNEGADIFEKCDNYLEFAFDNKNIYDLLFSQSVVEFLKFPNILEVADNAFQTLLESVKDHDKSLNDLSASNKAVHIWSFLHGITSISKKMDVALALPDTEMPIPVRSIKRARDNLRQFIEDLF